MEQPNAATIIQSLYVVIGKKAVEVDALSILNKQSKAHIEALQKELKELKSNGDRPD